MDQKQKEAILATVEKVRKDTGSYIVLGLMDEDVFFYSVDEKVSLDELEQILKRNASAIVQSVANKRHGGRR